MDRTFHDDLMMILQDPHFAVAFLQEALKADDTGRVWKTALSAVAEAHGLITITAPNNKE